MIESYNKLKANGKNFEIVFVSWDKDEDEFEDYYKDMPWMAINKEHEDKIDGLNEHFGIDGRSSTVYPHVLAFPIKKPHTKMGPRGTGGSRRSHWRGPVATSAKNTEQISELGGSGGMPPRKFFFNDAKCCNLGHFLIFFSGLSGRRL